MDEEYVRIQEGLAASRARTATLTARTAPSHHVFRDGPHHRPNSHHHEAGPDLCEALYVSSFRTTEELATSIEKKLVSCGSARVHVLAHEADDHDLLLRGLSLAASTVDKTYGVTLMFECTAEMCSTSKRKHSGASSAPHTGLNQQQQQHHHHHNHGSATGSMDGVDEFVLLVQLAERSNATSDVILRFEAIQAGCHSDPLALSEMLWQNLISQGAAWFRCTWAPGSKRVPNVLMALARSARHVRTRLGTATVKAVPRLVKGKGALALGAGKDGAHHHVIYLAAFNYPVQQ